MKNQPNAEIKWYKQAMLNHQTKKPTSKQTKEWTCLKTMNKVHKIKMLSELVEFFFFSGGIFPWESQNI